ncbi:hypothetical protein F4818DRAFT_396320 [Hypoxylon cercidicola]|nr:hypothetical protein F4818DRAFT_396320 [Hypoxylon cercidicola]
MYNVGPSIVWRQWAVILFSLAALHTRNSRLLSCLTKEEERALEKPASSPYSQTPSGLKLHETRSQSHLHWHGGRKWLAGLVCARYPGIPGESTYRVRFQSEIPHSAPPSKGLRTHRPRQPHHNKHKCHLSQCLTLTRLHPTPNRPELLPLLQRAELVPYVSRGFEKHPRCKCVFCYAVVKGMPTHREQQA